MRNGIFPSIRIRSSSGLFLIAALWLSATPKSTTFASSTTSKDASSLKSADFDPKGKSFGDFILEAQRAYAAGDYDRVIDLMNWVLAHGIDTDRAAIATIGRGSAYGAKGDLDRAMQDFDEALKLNPRSAQGYRDRGVVLAKRNDLDAAIKDFDMAIELQPDYWKSYLTRAEAKATNHQWEAALSDLEKVLKLNSKCAPAYAGRAFVEERYKKYQEALADGERAVSIDANYFAGYMARAYALIGLKQLPQAEQDLRSVVSMKAKDRSAQFNAVAWVRATSPEPSIRNGKEALSLATNACDLTNWKNGRYIDTLAAAHAEAGDFESAIKEEQQALNLMENSPPPNIFEFRDRLALYQKQQPFRDERTP